MIPRAVLIVLFGCFLCVGKLASCDEQAPPELAEPVRAYFLGYENDDLIFRIYNDLDSSIGILGLSFNGQILYRPVEKAAEVPAGSAESPYKDVVFRTTGDFVWSENHMTMFKLAYQLPADKVKLYGVISPPLSASDLEKGLVTESKP